MRVPRLSARDRRLLDTLYFLVRLLLLSVPLYLILSNTAVLQPLQEAVTAHSHALITFLGMESVKTDLVIITGTCDPFAIFIGPDCTGWKSMLLFFALVFATLRVSMKKRLLGLAVGIPVLYAANIVRIAAAVAIQQAYGTQAALFFHDVAWQAGLTAVVVALWLAWLFWARISPALLAACGSVRSRVKHIIGRAEE